MIYQEPLFLIGGDSFVTMELGNDGSLHLNLYIIALEKKILSAQFPWLTDTTLMRTTLMVQYDPLLIKADAVRQNLRELIADGVAVPEEIDTKLIHLPVYYDDPVSRACAASYGAEPSMELIAAENNMSVAEVISLHTKPRYFASYICFTYGSFGSFPLDPAPALKNSKYKSPRKWTPPGTLGLGGTISFFYPISSPGGLQMLGSIPCLTTDPEGKNKYFKETGDPLLVRPGYALKYFSIDEKEYEYIKAHVYDYEYKIEETKIQCKES